MKPKMPSSMKVDREFIELIFISTLAASIVQVNFFAIPWTTALLQAPVILAGFCLATYLVARLATAAFNFIDYLWVVFGLKRSPLA